MIEPEEIVNFTFSITIPKTSIESGSGPLGDLPLSNFLTRSFSNLDTSEIKLRDSLTEVLDLIPSMEFMGNNGKVTLGSESLKFSLRPLYKKPKKEEKNKARDPWTLGQLKDMDRDATFLFSTILGKLNLADKKLKTSILLKFRRKDTFPTTFIEKIDKELVKRTAIQEVRELTFMKKDMIGEIPAEIEYNFYKIKEESDSIGIEIRYEEIFSPISSEKILEQINDKVTEFRKLLEG